MTPALLHVWQLCRLLHQPPVLLTVQSPLSDVVQLRGCAILFAVRTIPIWQDLLCRPKRVS